MEVTKRMSSKIEQGLNAAAIPVKPYLSHVGRFLLISTFLEDAMRIWAQWGDQLRYMQTYRRFPAGLSHAFLIYNVCAMLAGSGMAVARVQTTAACTLLASVVVLQSFGYGLLSNWSFMARNISLIGGLLLLLAENAGGRNGRRQVFPGLPSLSEVEKGTYVSLLGRILLVCLFGSLLFGGSLGGSGPMRGAVILTAGVLSVMIAVGFKARYSAVFLVALLSLFNVIAHQWWSLHPESAERDFLRYDFFQTLSIIGGFLLLVDAGPGELSIDEKKKTF